MFLRDTFSHYNVIALQKNVKLSGYFVKLSRFNVDIIT